MVKGAQGLGQMVAFKIKLFRAYWRSEWIFVDGDIKIDLLSKAAFRCNNFQHADTKPRTALG